MRYLIQNGLSAEELVESLRSWCDQQGNIFSVMSYESCYPEKMDIAIIDSFGELSDFQILDLEDSYNATVAVEHPFDRQQLPALYMSKH
ncbi:MAG: hypothetical protein GX640_18510 [Fibrobacter sp.]|nr:hypothetical protein [Fibrobacter sp.]